MKKIITSIIALACCACAQAKTLEELVAGIPAYTDSVKFGGAPRYAYVTENYADFEREFASYLRSGIAEKDFRDLSDAELAVRKAMAPFYTKYGDKFDVSDAAGIRLSVPAFFKFTGITKYNEIKNAEWTLGGQTLSPGIIFCYALAAGDTDHILSMNIDAARSAGRLKTWAKIKAKALFNFEDKTAAYNEASKLEGELRGLCDDSESVQYAIKQFAAAADFLFVDATRRNKLK